MSRVMNIVSNIAAVLYFIFIMFWVSLILVSEICSLVMDMISVVSIGYSTSFSNAGTIVVLSFFIGLSLLVPAFRKIYYKLPWLLPFVIIMFVNLLILFVSNLLVHYGFESQNSLKHYAFIAIALIQLIACRLLMCFYLSKRKIQYIGGGLNGK